MIRFSIQVNLSMSVYHVTLVSPPQNLSAVLATCVFIPLSLLQYRTIFHTSIPRRYLLLICRSGSNEYRSRLEGMAWNAS